MSREPLGGLHDISLLLGRLTNQTETLLRQTQDLQESLSDLQAKGSDTLVVLESIKGRVDALETTLEKAVLPSIADYKRVKQRGLGMLSVVGLLSGTIVTMWPRILKAITGGG